MPDNIHAAKLEAIMALLLGATTDEELAEARKKAQAIRAMSDEEIQKLAAEPTPSADMPETEKKHTKPIQYGKAHNIRDGVEALAWFYADYLNALSDVGKEADQAALELIDQEMADSGWKVDSDDLGRWHVAHVEDGEDEPEGEDSEWDDHDDHDWESVEAIPMPFHRSVAALLYSAARCPQGRTLHIGGKTYRDGMFIPGKALAKATPEQKEEVAKANEKSEVRADERKKNRPVDPLAELKALVHHSPRDVAPREVKFLAVVCAALQEIHGEETPARVLELYRPVKSALTHGEQEGLKDQEGRLGKLAEILLEPKVEVMTAAVEVSPKEFEEEEVIPSLVPELFSKLASAAATLYGSDDVLPAHEDEAKEALWLAQGEPSTAEPEKVALLYQKAGERVPGEVVERLASLHYESHRAPKGGVDIGGKHYPGGEFIPANVVANATGEERSRVKGGSKKSGKDKKLDKAEDGEDEEPPAEWDGIIDARRVRHDSYLDGAGDRIAHWDFRDSDDVWPQTVSMEAAEYDPDPANLDLDMVDIFRWVSGDDGGTHDQGEWTTDYNEAFEAGKKFAREHHEEEPEDDDVNDDDSSSGGGPKPGVRYASGADRTAVDRVVRNFFGEDFSLENVASLVGAPEDDSTVLIQEGSRKLFVSIDNPDFEQTCERYFKRDSAGDLFCYNELTDIKKSSRGSGLGSRMFAKQVEECKNAGVKYIQNHSARLNYADQPYFNGFYTWPRMGYDADLEQASFESTGDSQRLAETQVKFPDAKTVQDVMATPEGREWWKKNGFGLKNARFDLTPGSRSLQVLEAYLHERAQKKE